MANSREKNADWTLPVQGRTWEHVHAALLMDIRDELQSIVRLLNCHRIPRALDAVVAMHKQGVKRRTVKKRSVRRASK